MYNFDIIFDSHVSTAIIVAKTAREQEARQQTENLFIILYLSRH